MVEVQNLAKVFPNGYQALNDVSFTLHGGEFVCVIGRSGAGKSTLLRCLNGLIPITSGSVRIDGVDLATLSDSARLKMRRRIGFIFQEFNLVGRLTAMQNVLTGRLGYMNEFEALLGYYGHSHRTIAVACLKRVNMLHRAYSRADFLSGGEKQRVSIARALAQQPVLLLAVSHDLGVIKHLARRTMVMKNGHVVESGLTDQILEDPQHPYTQLLVSSAL